MKDKVIIEYLNMDEIDENKVAVYTYDGDLHSNEPIEVCHKIVAMEEYEIVGELTFNGVELYKEGSIDDEDFSEFSLVDEDDC